MKGFDKEKLKKELLASNFKENNGLILLSLNILQTKYTKLISLYSVFKTRNLGEDDFVESINFLAEEEYIYLRDIDTKNKSSLDSSFYKDLESKLSSKGLRLLNGGLSDNMVEV